MPYEKRGLRDSRSSNDISQCGYETSEAPPYRRYTEGSNFRARTQFEADVLTNSSSDLFQQSQRHRTLSDDFQDSLYFSNPPQRTMSLSGGGTHSLPAFLSGPSGNHAALQQQIQANQRAVDNDYSEQPHACVGPPTLPRTSSHGTRLSSTHPNRHRHFHRPTSGRRAESASRHRSNREEGTHPAFQNGFTTTERHFVPLHDVDQEAPPPRPPLSRLHFEHAGPGRALRISSSLPSSLTFNAGESILVPMAHNAAPSRHHRHERRGRHHHHRRVPDTMGHTAPRSQRGYSLTPPPVCRANKPRYDGNNRLIQTVSSPSVVTQCVRSAHSPHRPSPRVDQPTSKNTSTKNNNSKTDPALLQPTHVVISQQPRRKSSKKEKKHEDDDDEITHQKKGIVVSLNNNVTKCPHSVVTVQSKDGTTTMSSISSKMSDDSILKKEECAPMLHATDQAQDGDPSPADSSNTGTKPGDHNYPCPRCGKCTCERCQELPGPAAAAARRMAAHCWMCNHRCLCTVDSCVETATCLCCVRGMFYHCSNYEDDDICADKPCSCQSDKCCLRWTIMGALSICLPCLWCYPLARGCVKLCRSCSGSLKPGCKCKDSYR